MYINTCLSKSERSIDPHPNDTVKHQSPVPRPPPSPGEVRRRVVTPSGNTLKALDSRLLTGNVVVGALFEAASFGGPSGVRRMQNEVNWDTEIVSTRSQCPLAGGHVPRVRLSQRHMARHTAPSLCEVSA